MFSSVAPCCMARDLWDEWPSRMSNWGRPGPQWARKTSLNHFLRSQPSFNHSVGIPSVFLPELCQYWIHLGYAMSLTTKHRWHPVANDILTWQYGYSVCFAAGLAKDRSCTFSRDYSERVVLKVLPCSSQCQIRFNRATFQSCFFLC